MGAETIKIGVMGSGGYGETARSYLRNTGEYEIVACHDSNAAVAERAAADERATAYTDSAAFLAHPGMQAVSINTPIPLHAEQIYQCLSHGKHVFVTKPVTASLSDAHRVADLARARGLALVVGHHARLRPAIRLIRSLVADGRLGRLCNVTVTTCSSRGLASDPNDWRFADKGNPGGPLLHCGVHVLDILISVLGPVRRVAAMSQDDVTPHPVEDNYMVLLEFVSGVQASITSNYTTGYLHTMHWMGVDANVHLHEHISHLGQCDLFLQRRRGGECEPWEQLPLNVDAAYPDDHDGVLEKSFARQIRQRAPDYDNLHQAIAVLEVVEAAISSARTGRFVTPRSRPGTSPAVHVTLTPAGESADARVVKGATR